jgi:hypothetical protein
MSRPRHKSNLLLFCSLILFGATCFAQDAPEKVEQRLTGAHGHDWIAKPIVQFLGPGDKCKEGEKYRFKSDHTVVFSQCIDSHMLTETHPWSIQSVGALDTYIKVGDTTYTLTFWDDPKGHYMKLRTRSIETKMTVDKDFKLAED